MNAISYEKKDYTAAVLTVETTAEEFEKEVNAAYLKSRKDINIPGFRRGKASRAMIESMYGHQVFYQDAMDELAQPAFEEGLNAYDVKFVGYPSISNVEVTENKTVIFQFTVTPYPEAELGQYKGLEATREEVVVTDEDVAAEIENIRKRNARKVSVDRPAQLQDTANIDYDGFLEGERFEGGKAEGQDLVLGSNSFVPGFEEQIVGMTVGEEKDLDITFPEDYHEELAGKAVVFKVKLNGLTVDELPELDDDFAQDVSEFDTLSEYTDSVRKELIKKRNDQADASVCAQVIEKAVANMSVEIPDVMIDEQAEQIVRSYARNFGVDSTKMSFDELSKLLGMDEETMSKSIRPSAEAKVKQELLHQAIIKAENLQPTEEEKEAFLQRMADDMKETVEELKEYVDDEFVTIEATYEMVDKLLVSTAVLVAPAEKEPAAEDASEETTEEKAEE